RASTTPSWSRRSGVTTCASRASWWRCSTGPTTSPSGSRTSPPAPGVVGILVDHLVPGSKESRIAAEVMRLPGAAGNVTVLGHPYVDVWQAVRPARVGLTKWPHVPKGTDIKVGTLAALGWPRADQADI